MIFMNPLYHSHSWTPIWQDGETSVAQLLEVDRSHLADEQQAVPPAGPRSNASLSLNAEQSDEEFFRCYKKLYGDRGSKNESFPLKLYRILYETERNHQEHIISFCPSGRAIKIHDVEAFVKEIMPKYFASNRFASFQRQLNLYGFSKILRGDEKGGFSHSAFCKGNRNLSSAIKRKTQQLKVPPHLLLGALARSEASPATDFAPTKPPSSSSSQCNANASPQQDFSFIQELSGSDQTDTLRPQEITPSLPPNNFSSLMIGNDIRPCHTTPTVGASPLFALDLMALSPLTPATRSSTANSATRNDLYQTLLYAKEKEIAMEKQLLALKALQRLLFSRSACNGSSSFNVNL